MDRAAACKHRWVSSCSCQALFGHAGSLTVCRILRDAVPEELIKADVAPVQQIFRDGLRFLFGPGAQRHE